MPPQLSGIGRELIGPTVQCVPPFVFGLHHLDRDGSQYLADRHTKVEGPWIAVRRRLLSVQISATLSEREFLNGISQHRSWHGRCMLIEERFQDHLRSLPNFSQHPA